MLKAIIATIKPSGVVYNPNPVLSLNVSADVIKECRETPHCTSPAVHTDDFVGAIKKLIGTDVVKIKRQPGRMPWGPALSGLDMDIKTILENFGDEGWPGYDCFMDGLRVYKGIARFGKEVYALCPVSVGQEAGWLEVQPFKENYFGL